MKPPGDDNLQLHSTALAFDGVIGQGVCPNGWYLVCYTRPLITFVKKSEISETLIQAWIFLEVPMAPRHKQCLT